MHCECCDGPLACYEGEWYCPDCLRFEVEEQARQADEEAAALRQAEAARPADPLPDDVIPF